MYCIECFLELFNIDLELLYGQVCPHFAAGYCNSNGYCEN